MHLHKDDQFGERAEHRSRTRCNSWEMNQMLELEREQVAEVQPVEGWQVEERQAERQVGWRQAFRQAVLKQRLALPLLRQ